MSVCPNVLLRPGYLYSNLASYGCGENRGGLVIDIARKLTIQADALTQHSVKFFESDEQRLDTICEYVTSSLRENAVTLVLTPGRFHSKIQQAADHLGLQGSQLELLDAEHLMCQILVKKEASRENFDLLIRPHVMNLIKAAEESGRPIRLYGDIVNSLCEIGYDKAAMALEGFWHDLVDGLPPKTDFYLICGYLLEHFSTAKSTDSFEKVCHLHRHVLPIHEEASNRSDETNFEQSIGYLKTKVRQQDRALRREIAEQERLQALGEMSATVSHELANPLTTLIYSIERLEKWTAEQPLPAEQLDFLQNHLGRARRSSNKLNEVNRNVLNLSRSINGTSEIFLLQTCIETATSQLSYRILDRGIQLRVDMPDAKLYPILVNGSRTSIEQVLTNLLVNASDSIIERLSRDAGAADGKIELFIDRQSPTEVFVYVTDNGLGVPADAKDQIFQSFFTTKPIGKGTGIGLTFSQKVVRKHGGELEYIDKPNFANRPNPIEATGGACFRIRLPVTSPQD